MKKFVDRSQAGMLLAKKLHQYKKHNNTIILCLPRGGVPVGYEVAKILSIPWDVFIVRKLGVPGYKELAMGALASGGTLLFNKSIIKELSITKNAINQVIDTEEKELKRRELLYRGNRFFPSLQGKTILLIDDGIATGATTRVAVKALYQFSPEKIILATPVAALSSYMEIKKEVDEMICLLKPIDFHAVGCWYENFSQTTDKEVTELLLKQTHN